MTVNRQPLSAVLAWIAVVVIAWFAYAPALTGAFLLDDVSNLDGLRNVDDRLSALIFVFSGSAGPSGRPLALASFLPQAAAWGVSAEPFLKVNIAIHLVNGCLLAWVLYLLAVAARVTGSRAGFAALAAAAIWLLMPLLASSSLMIIQRMTTLSAFFSLLGLAGYLHARRSIEDRPRRALVLMAASLAAGTLLGVLAKENGALLPTLVLVAEATLLHAPGSIRKSRWRAWKLVFLALPTLAILGLLVSSVPYSDTLALRKDFTGWERLLTEARVLWQYLFYAFLPQPGQYGPFHDGYEVARTILDALTALAVLGWVVVLCIAAFWRRRYPLFAFAVLWYVGGHLLESTVIPLELYFEHRNYLPIVGPVFAFCILISQFMGQRSKFVYAGMSAYLLINAALLFSATSLWGQPAMAAMYWQETFPRSMRAATNAAGFRLNSGPEETIQTLRDLVTANPGAGFVKIQELNLSCIIAPRGDHRGEVAELQKLLGQVDFSYTAATMLSQLLTTVERAGCNGVNGETVRSLASVLQSNPRYENDGAFLQLYHQLVARTLRQEGDYDQTLQHLEKAVSYGHSSRLNMMMVTTLADAKRFDAARSFIAGARQREPWHPVKKYLWERDLEELSLYIDELERAHAKSARSGASLP
jgi:hypothetical protein